MQPYQKASEQVQNQSRVPGEALMKLGKVGASIVGGSAVLNRIAPFLNEHIPNNIASKALSKIDPRFGKFIQGSLANGQSMDEVMGFIKDKMSPEAEDKPKEQRNIIQQYSPELHKFMEGQIQQGRPALEAGAVAQSNPKFQKIIQKMSKDHKSDWSAILQTVYGQAQQPQSKAGLQPEQQMQQQGQPQQGNSDQALMAALDKILKM